VNRYVRITVSAVLLGAIAWHTDWEQVRRSFAGLRYELWLGALALLGVCQVASARRWQVLAHELRFERSVPQLLAYYLIGMYFNLLLPTSVGGDVMRAWYLDGGARRKLAALAAVLLDRLNGLLVLIAMACLAVALSPLALPAWIVWSVWGIAAAAAVGLASLPVLQRLDLLPQSRREQLRTMVQALRAPRALVEATLWSVLVQVLNVVLVWLIGQALGTDVPLPYYFVFVPMVSLLTLLPVSINGLGVREGGVVLFLAPLGVAPAIAAAMAFLWFAVFAAAGLVGGAVYLCGAYSKPVPTVPTGG
jgi:glycosyltransferase 2 family protein